MRFLFLLLCLLVASPAWGLTVNKDGTISCSKGLEMVYWQEDTGGGELYRDVISLFYEELEPRTALRHIPSEDRSEIIYDLSAGIGIPWRGFGSSDGKNWLGPYRFLEVKSHPETDYKGAAVGVILVGMEIYWPVCARTEALAEWFAAAEPDHTPAR